MAGALKKCFRTNILSVFAIPKTGDGGGGGFKNNIKKILKKKQKKKNKKKN